MMAMNWSEQRIFPLVAIIRLLLKFAVVTPEMRFVSQSEREEQLWSGSTNDQKNLLLLLS